MQPAARHQCLIYKGSPARHLQSLAAVVRDKLRDRCRCLYFDSPPMVAGMRSYVAAAGIDVAGEVEKGSLILSSDRPHLVNGCFDVGSMVRALDDAVQHALSDGYAGLWASGDMTWEIGAKKDVSRLLEYEWKLEELFRTRPCLSGICQYHADTLPQHAVREALLTHQSIFINETLSRLNPHYTPAQAYSSKALPPDLDVLIERLCEPNVPQAKAEPRTGDGFEP